MVRTRWTISTSPVTLRTLRCPRVEEFFQKNIFLKTSRLHHIARRRCRSESFGHGVRTRLEVCVVRVVRVVCVVGVVGVVGVVDVVCVVNVVCVVDVVCVALSEACRRSSHLRRRRRRLRLTGAGDVAFRSWSSLGKSTSVFAGIGFRQRGHTDFLKRAKQLSQNSCSQARD